MEKTIKGTSVSVINVLLKDVKRAIETNTFYDISFCVPGGLSINSGIRTKLFILKDIFPQNMQDISFLNQGPVKKESAKIFTSCLKNDLEDLINLVQEFA
jgi:hypothetical protein